MCVCVCACATPDVVEQSVCEARPNLKLLNGGQAPRAPFPSTTVSTDDSR